MPYTLLGAAAIAAQAKVQVGLRRSYALAVPTVAAAQAIPLGTTEGTRHLYGHRGDGGHATAKVFSVIAMLQHYTDATGAIVEPLMISED